MKTPEPQANDYIVPLNMNGLEGRMLKLPAPPRYKREILFVYGHHSSLERWWGLMQVLNRYGAVTMPDLPGFGGMESFYKIGRKPTIDEYADYLAAFIKWRYKRKKVIVAGMSFGFVVVTRMLQRYPELAGKVQLLVSIAGFTHKDDFCIPKPMLLLYKIGALLFSVRPTAWFLRYFILNRPVLRFMYRVFDNEKLRTSDKAQFERLINQELRLWHDNDVCTAMRTTLEFFRLDNCQKKVNLPVSHVAITGDRYFDNTVVEQHLRVIFTDFKLLSVIDTASHAPSVIATAKEAAPFVPQKLRRQLRNLP